MQIKIDRSLNILIGISSCLLGQAVRYDGAHKANPILLEALNDAVQWVPICPEVEVGMTVPREPLSLFGDPQNPRMHTNLTQKEYSQEMRAWASTRLAAPDLISLDGYILKSRSPSCGLKNVPVYPNNLQDTPKLGRGLFAQALVKKFPHLPIEEESRLQDPAVMKEFVEKVIEHARQRKISL